MSELTAMQGLIISLAEGGKESDGLRSAVLKAHPNSTDGGYFSDVLTLLNRQRLVGSEVNGQWLYTSVSPESIVDLEYSPEFAEMIIAADCGEWTEIDPDDLIAQLDAMIEKAKRKRARKG
jgi:hypothetical protein